MSIYTRYIVISRLKTFALLHIKMKKAFCIVLVDSTQELSRRYCLNLKNKGFVDTSKAIYNIADVNISSNAWYMKWLLSSITTFDMCVFRYWDTH